VRTKFVCDVVFLRVSVCEIFGVVETFFSEKKCTLVGFERYINAYIFQRISNIREDARRFSHLLEAYLPPVSFVSYPCESPAKLSRLRI